MLRRISIGVAISLGLLMAGCNTPVASDGNAGGDNQNPTEAKIIIVLVNNASLPVDPHLYISPNKLSADALFADANNIVADFNGKTTIDAGDIISKPFDYKDVVTIGSSQASFGDVNSWRAGQSVDSPVLHQGDDFSANKVIVFTFSKDEQGTYHTTYRVSDTIPIQ